MKLESAYHWENTKNAVTEDGGVHSARSKQGDIEGKCEREREKI
jgi:hypothetical protein